MKLARHFLCGALALGLSVSAAGQLTDPEVFLEDVKYLASPEMRGRGAGMPELDVAAAYIAQRFEEAGLEPAGDNGFLQPLTVTTGAVMGAANSLVVGGDSLGPAEDYVPINFSASGEASGPLVFAGYGIVAEEKGYDDYTHLDVDGKVVVLLRYEPPTFSGGQGSRRYTRHANLISKAINARNRGAVGVILANGYREGSDRDELIKFGSVSGPQDAGIPMVQVKNAVVDGWLESADTSLRELQSAINDATDPTVVLSSGGPACGA